jgi:hypothetical protein
MSLGVFSTEANGGAEGNQPSLAPLLRFDIEGMLSQYDSPELLTSVRQSYSGL